MNTTQQWPADKVERRALASLLPNARNVRTHSEAQIAQIAASIREWGWTIPILVDESGIIIAGHGRVLAAAQLALVDVPVMTARGWTDAQKRAYLIADNKLTDNGGWDQTLLRLELADLATLGFAPTLTGFTENEIEAMTAPENDPFREWVGMPDYQQSRIDAIQTVAIHFKTVEDVQAFARLVNQQISDKTKFLWFPPVEDESRIDKQFVAAAE